MESVLLERYRSAVHGAVLELVPGGSRLTEELVHQARTYVGVGPSATVINVCRQMYLNGRFVIGDLDALEGFDAGAFDVVFAGRCAIDSLSGERRRGLFESVGRVLAPGGLMIFSSHNAAAPELQQIPDQTAGRRRGGRLRGLRLRSSRAPMDDRELGNELLSGIDGDLSAGPYRITREDQQSQLTELGLSLVECIDLSGHQVPADEPAAHSPELHYVVRPASAEPAGALSAEPGTAVPSEPEPAPADEPEPAPADGPEPAPADEPESAPADEPEPAPADEPVAM